MLYSNLTTKNVVIVDLGLGNLGSVSASFTRMGVKTVLAQKPKDDLMTKCTHMVLPGVGSFLEGVTALEQTGWTKWIQEVWVPSFKPLLGICLGMQLLASRGSEGLSSGEQIHGLDLIPGHVDLLPSTDKITVPHVGWNSIDWNSEPGVISRNIQTGTDFYFVHSYAFFVEDPSHAIATSVHGRDFSSIVKKNNIVGVQFHPEKSQMAGKSIILNFLEQG